MNGAEILERARDRISDDVASKYLVSDALLLAWLNEAEAEAAERALLLEDQAQPKTAAVTALTQSGGVATAESIDHPFLDGEILEIEGAADSPYNREAPIAFVDADHFTYPVPITAPGSTSGTITASLVSGNICNIDGVDNVAVYLLDDRIIEIRSATWDGRFLDLVSEAELDAGHPRVLRGRCLYDERDWRRLTGTPTRAIDQQNRRLMVVPKPVDGKVLHLSVFRRPLLTFTADNYTTREPELHPREHAELIYWIEMRHYERKDTEFYDQRRAATAEGYFTARFGEKPDANVRRKRREGRNHAIVMNPSW